MTPFSRTKDLASRLVRFLRRKPKILIALALALAVLATTGVWVYRATTIALVAVPEDILNGKTLPPLPAGYRLITAGDEARKGHGKIAFSVETEIIEDRAALPKSVDSLALVSRDYRVPVEGGGTKLLSELAPGETALPLNGQYLDNPEYPAIAFRFARIASSRGKKVPAALERWLSQAFPEAPKDEVVFVAAVGDLMPGRGVERIFARSDGAERVFGDTLPILRSNDLMIGNLEGAVTEGNAQATKSYTFKYGTAVLPVLKKAGFTYLMLTNNHSFDYGAEGFADTRKAVRAAGFATSGVGENLAEAKRFWRTQIKGTPISVISCGAYPVERTGFDGAKTAAALESRPGILWESGDIPALVKAEKATGAFVIVCVHGGEEYRFTPSARQTAFYRALADSGADAVFGSHPHVLQPIERRGNALIVYSLGNFLFPGMGGMSGAEDSEIVRLGVVRGRIVYREVYPAKLDGTRVALAKR
ncbi:MAG TPA: CapA family protein [Treponemataceae bacterium]|nr:CapA family protein [Treponemataceae bacterium]HPS43040.1 CapA family protein [Treponemataceae bacterium]